MAKIHLEKGALCKREVLPSGYVLSCTTLTHEVICVEEGGSKYYARGLPSKVRLRALANSVP